MTRRSWRLLAIPILGLAGLSLACTSGGGGLLAQRADHSQVVEELKRRVLELQRQAAVHEEEILRLGQRVEELERREPASTDSSPPPPASVPLAEPVEVFRPAVIEESDLEVPSRTQPPRPSPVPVEAGPTSEAPMGGSGSISAQALYDRGYTLYHQGQYREAETAFARFLRDHSGSDLADNAQYWVGESRYARKDYQGALEAFRETVEQFPQGNKVPDAMLKAGQCFEALGDSEAARETYEEIARRYPESAASVRAQDRIRRLQ